MMGVVLYPEEVDALLMNGTVAHIEQMHLDDDASFLMSDQVDPPSRLVPSLMGLCTELSFMQAVYLLEVVPPHAPTEPTVLIAWVGAPKHAERAVGVTISDVQLLCVHNNVALDIATFDPAKERSAYLRQPGVERLYGPPFN